MLPRRPFLVVVEANLGLVWCNYLQQHIPFFATFFFAFFLATFLAVRLLSDLLRSFLRPQSLLRQE